ncbi:MAG: dihydrolipoyllysine-residue acetyltransferase [Legionella sp.]|nr:dihydrolipoyllysine-residue acetyltransferase [Legionella sp.]
MANDIEVKIPDIGTSAPVDVIEILVKEGDKITPETSLITLESDKASMEIPASVTGTVKQIKVKVGDKVSEGDIILMLNAEATKSQESSSAQPSSLSKEEVKSAEEKQTSSVTKSTQAKEIEVKIPDIGVAAQVDVIEIMVNKGDEITTDTPLITLESDKASMEIPSPVAGKVLEVKLKVGDKVSEGDLILVVSSSEDAEPIPTEIPKTVDKESSVTSPSTSNSAEKQYNVASSPSEYSSSNLVAAGPAVRRLARELGVNLEKVKGSGRKARVTKEDIQAYVKQKLSEKPTAGGFGLPAMPAIDFSSFGEIETKPLNKIKRLTGGNVHRSWVTIPHVTQFDAADITEIEAFRKSEAEKGKNQDYKLTLLAFVTAVVCKALKLYPQFNASLDASGENLIYKKYFNIGIAVETPNGLVVPVIKNVDQLSIAHIAREMSRLSTKAREKGLMPADMSGGCFTISSLGGIGGTAFTPIVNSPEVAILGLSRSEIKPVYQQGAFQPRLILPLSLSYDHRVIDGAEAARFTRYISECLADIRKILL